MKQQKVGGSLLCRGTTIFSSVRGFMLPLLVGMSATLGLAAAETSDYDSGRHFKHCADCPMMVVIPPGSFMMGSPPEETTREKIPERDAAWERPQHKVEIRAAFAMGERPVTFDEWDACVAGGGCNAYRPADRYHRLDEISHGKRPVSQVSWLDANAFIDFLNTLTRHTGKGEPYYLPSEAEWEYAARAGSTTARWWGDDPRNRGNRNMAASDEFEMPGIQTAYPANPFGLFDMLGLRWQWTADCWHENYDAAPVDGSARTDGDCDRRAIRGGYSGWLRPWRSAGRTWHLISIRSQDTGFRVARRLP